MNKTTRLNVARHAEFEIDMPPSESFRAWTDAMSGIGAAETAEAVWTLVDAASAAIGVNGGFCRCCMGDVLGPAEDCSSRDLEFNDGVMRVLWDLPSYLDPLFQATTRAAKPLTCEQIDAYLTEGSPQSELYRTSLRAMGNGLLVPVFGPMAQHGYFCFQIECGAAPGPAETVLLQSLAQTAYVKLIELKAPTFVESGALSVREMEVVNLLSKGYSNKQAANELNISINSINTYVNRVFDKLGVSDRVTATTRARMLGYIA